MSGQQAYIYQEYNKVVDAAITSNVSPSSRAPLVYPLRKQGNGNIRLYGNYSGDKDARYEVKILDSILQDPVVSAPVFRGAGTGKISDIAVSNLEAQKIRILCLSTGTESRKAEIELEGYRFRAKEAGASGNAIYLLIDDSSLVFTASDYSVIKPLKVGDTALEGQEWDFDTKVLQGEFVPEDAHRLAFGQDRLHIYTQYKKFEEGVWKYYFILPIQYEVKAGERVYFVSGGRTITVTDGATTEEYTDIVTIADFWQKVKASSGLIEPVDSSIDTSRSITSPAVREFSTKTEAYFMPPYRDEKSSEYAGDLQDIEVSNDKAKTELIRITCISNAYVGDEVWEVKGSSSGDLGQVRTGEYAYLGPVGFRIPQKLPKNWGEVNENWSYKIDYAPRDAGVDPPAICFSLRMGINSVPQTLELTYKKKPPECYCPPVGFSDKCLGFEEKGGETGMAYIVQDLSFWTDVVINRMAEKWQEQEPYLAGSSSEAYEKQFLKLIDRNVEIFKGLAQRIMNLPEEDASALQAMVDQYKTLVNSQTVLVMLNSSFTQYAWASWDGSKWIYDTQPSSKYSYLKDATFDTDLYQTLADAILNYEQTYGVKKNNVIGIGTCYQDTDDDYYWEISGSKAYLPAYTDVPYYSTVQSGNDYINTKEFALLVSIPCGGTLVEGDKITVEIGGVVYEKTYQVGDITYLPTVARQNLNLTGGRDGDDTYTWEVSGEIDKFPDYLLDRKTPARYITPQLSFQIEDGIVPFDVGDVFEFTIEGGRWIWRKDGGAWSSPLDIKKEAQTFDSGLQIAFDFGVSPSFIQNDTWEVLCIQENKASNLATPGRTRRKGPGDVTFAFSSQVTIDTLVIDMHDIGTDIVFKASNVSDFSVIEYSETISPTSLICRLFGTPITAQYFRLEISGETSIGYVFLGTRMQLSLDADSIRPMRQYNMSRQEAKEPFSLLKYARKGYMIDYSSFIYNADFEALEQMIDYLKTNNDMPFYFVANISYPEDCIRAYIDTDNIEVESPVDINAPKANRLFSLKLPVIGVQ
ncbi:MAG: hypothetical protein GXP46_01975 [Deferribacteres bacterium]|nr:hypothetical protein [Deferribacteres bacterium]